jgi:hypothetical protein
MVLAADIIDSGGRLLLPVGTTLSEKHLRFCQMWGVLEAEIVAGEDELEPEETTDPAQLEAARTAVLPRFRHVDPSHPVIDVLLHHAIHAQLTRPV